MSLVKEIKNKLGELYSYEQYITEKEVRRLKKINPPKFDLMTVCSLTAGYVKIEVSVFKWDGQVQLGYDVFVKDAPNTPEWICYDSPSDTVVLKESALLSVLDKIVKDKELSYTECCFEKINGKLVKRNDTDKTDLSSPVSPRKAK